MFAPFGHAIAAGLIALSGGGAPRAAADQDHIANALAASSLRVLEAGYWSVGPGTRDVDFVSSCLGGLDSPGRLAPLPGETARAVSNVYLFQPDADNAPDVGELLTVAIVAVDVASETSLDWFVLLLGSADTADCRRTEYLSSPEAGAQAGAQAPTVDVVARPNLGRGTASSRLDMNIVFTSEGVQHRVAYSYLVARTDRQLVAMRVASFGEGPFSGLDAAAELAAIIASLNAA